MWPQGLSEWWKNYSPVEVVVLLALACDAVEKNPAMQNSRVKAQ